MTRQTYQIGGIGVVNGEAGRLPTCAPDPLMSLRAKRRNAFGRRKRG